MIMPHGTTIISSRKACSCISVVVVVFVFFLSFVHFYLFAIKCKNVLVKMTSYHLFLGQCQFTINFKVTLTSVCGSRSESFFLSSL